MTNYGWNIAVPANSVTIGSLPGHITVTRDQVATHLSGEHVAFAAGTGLDDMGGEHKEGSAKAYRQATTPTTRPDGSTGFTAGDDGRLWVDSDDDILHVYNASAFVQVSIAGLLVTDAEGDGSTKIADLVGLLPGRVGGQTLKGDTAQNGDLKLQATAYTTAHSTTSQIEFVATDTAKNVTNKIELNDILLMSLKLGEDADANSNDLKGLGAVATTGYAIGFGNADVTAACLKTTGTIAQAAQGAATGAGANLTADVGFTPDLVLAWPTSDNNNVWLWVSTASTYNTRLSEGTSISSGLRVSVSSTTITFTNSATGDYPNKSGTTFSYIALKFNAAAINPS